MAFVVLVLDGFDQSQISGEQAAPDTTKMISR